MTKHHQSIRALTEGAILIAAAEILSFLPLYKMPWGGSIDLAMLPVFVFCARWGFGPGMLVSFAHAILQTLFEGGIATICEPANLHKLTARNVKLTVLFPKMPITQLPCALAAEF